MNIKKFTPAVDKRILVLLAGIMWCGVGGKILLSVIICKENLINNCHFFRVVVLQYFKTALNTCSLTGFTL